MAKGLLIAALDFSKVPSSEFHDWQNKEHIPERMAVKGFISGKRWIGATDPNISVNTYDLESVDVLKTPAYLAFSGENASDWSKRIGKMYTRIMRTVGTQIAPGDEVQPDNAQAFLFNAMNVPPEHYPEFEDWYTQEHIPVLRAVPGCLCSRFFIAADDRSTHRYVAAYHLTGPEIPDTEAWKKAAGTPWSKRMREHFRDRVRIVCRRYEK